MFKYTARKSKVGRPKDSNWTLFGAQILGMNVNGLEDMKVDGLKSKNDADTLKKTLLIKSAIMKLFCDKNAI